MPVATVPERTINSPQLVEHWSGLNPRFKSMNGFLQQLFSQDSASAALPYLYARRASVEGNRDLLELTRDMLVSELVFKLRHQGYEDPDDPKLEEESDERVWYRRSRNAHRLAVGPLRDDKIQEIIDALGTFTNFVMNKDNYQDTEVDDPSKIEVKFKALVHLE